MRFKGEKPEAWLDVPIDVDDYEIIDLFNSCPPGTYRMEAWDVYKDGIFQRTEYNIHVR